MQQHSFDRALLHLVLLPGIGPAVVEKLLHQLTYANFAQLYTCTKFDLIAWGLPERVAEKIVLGLADIRLLEDELERMEQHGIAFINAFHEEYPALLKHIHLPPLGLYVQGTLPLLYDRSLAVVGSRQANAYGKHVIDVMLPPLVEQDWVIVSGGARGIDAFAHAATLAMKGKTIAVIGSGLLKPYPAQNGALFERIAKEGGAVVSPFPLTMQALPNNFPARNRIIAGMTRGALVVQAAARSGALITAYAALREGREVFAVPGSIFDPLSEGCHQLLAEGAHVAHSAAEVMRTYGVVGRLLVDNARTSEHRINEQACLPTAEITNEASTIPLLLRVCVKPQSIDAILAHTSYSQQELYGQLWEYQVAGLIEETSSGMWQTIVAAHQ